MEGNEKPYWNDHPNQTFDCNLGYFDQLFKGTGGLLHVIGGVADCQRQYYTTKEVFGILCRWYGKSVVYDHTNGWSSCGCEDSLGDAFTWATVSSDLDSALSYTEDNFDPYKLQPYTAYDVFRILYRLKYGEWLPAQEKFGGASADFMSRDEADALFDGALDYGLDKNGRLWALEAKRTGFREVEQKGSCFGASTDGREPSIPLKPSKKVHDGDALFSAIGRMGRK